MIDTVELAPKGTTLSISSIDAALQRVQADRELTTAVAAALTDDPLSLIQRTFRLTEAQRTGLARLDAGDLRIQLALVAKALEAGLPVTAAPFAEQQRFSCGVSVMTTPPSPQQPRGGLVISATVTIS